MRCNNCGAELRPDDRFCGECGEPRSSSTPPSTLPERGSGSLTNGIQSRKPPAPPVTEVPAAAHTSAAGLRARGRNRRCLLSVPALVALGLVITATVIVGALTLRSGRLDVTSWVPRLAGQTTVIPEEQVSSASFQAAARECQPMAVVTGIHEGIELDVMIHVERRLRDGCRITVEVVDDRTGYELTGERMTCRIPMQVLAEGVQPSGEFEDYCTGSLVKAVGELSVEGR